MTGNGAGQSSDGPLKGIRALDWTMWQLGPVASEMMGDMGADVIKIEPLDGDAGRNLVQATTIQANLASGRNAYFEANNRNKRGFAVNLKVQEGRELVYKLVESADVFVQNYREGVAGRLGMDYETLRKINPALVYASATGYGSKGEESSRPSFDGTGQARSGLMMSGTPLGGEPVRVGGGISDQIAGIMLCLGVLAALVSRSKTGKGQMVETSHLSANMWLQGSALNMSLMSGTSSAPFDRKTPVNPLTNTYRCQDGRWIQLMHMQPDRYWKGFTEVLGITELLEDPRFESMASRREHGAELARILDERFSTRPYDEWDRDFKAKGDFIYDKVQGLTDLVDDPQVIANEFIATFDHPVLGPTRMCSHPNIYSETPAGIWREAPELGQHTEEIMVEELGYTWEDVEKFREAGAIL